VNTDIALKAVQHANAVKSSPIWDGSGLSNAKWCARQISVNAAPLADLLHLCRQYNLEDLRSLATLTRLYSIFESSLATLFVVAQRTS